MLNVFHAVGEKLKELFTAHTLATVAADPHVESDVRAALSNVHVPTAVASVLNSVLPNAQTFTDAELQQAISDYIHAPAQVGADSAVISAAFTEGAKWVLNHVSETIKSAPVSNIAVAGDVALAAGFNAHDVAHVEQVAQSVATGVSDGGAKGVVEAVAGVAQVAAEAAGAPEPITGEVISAVEHIAEGAIAGGVPGAIAAVVGEVGEAVTK